MTLSEIFYYLFGIVGSIFTSLDQSQANLDGYSLLDLFIAILLIDIVLDFFLTMIDFDYYPDQGDDEE